MLLDFVNGWKTDMHEAVKDVLDVADRLKPKA
jgi:hypothetical protein